jgi:site-specific recombinase XerD
MNVTERFTAEHLVFNNISPGRCHETLIVLGGLESRLEEEGRDLSQVTSADFLGYSSELLAGGLHVNTVRKKMNMLRGFFTWAYTAGVITADQYLRLKAVKNPRGSTGVTQPKPYTTAEMAVFWETINRKLPYLPDRAAGERGRGSFAVRRWIEGKGPWARVWRHAFRLQLDCMIRLALDLGMRSSEIYGLSVDDVHYDNEYFVVRGKADPTTGYVKIREIPYTDEARARVYAWLEFRATMRPTHDRPWLVCYAQWRNNPMPEDRFGSLLQDSLGMGWRWHRLRHTCATEWLRAGMDLEQVSRLLGHATLQQTLCYVEISKRDIGKSMARRQGTFNEAVARAA